MIEKGPEVGKTGIFRWRVYIRIGERRIRKRFKATESEAYRIHAEFTDQGARRHVGLPYENRDIVPMLADAIAKYDTELKTQRRAETYRRQVAFSLTVLQEVAGAVRVNALNRTHMQDFITRRAEGGAKPQTNNTSRAHVRAFLQFCVFEGWLTENPMNTVRKMRETKAAPRIMPWADFCKFADAAWAISKEFGLLVEVLGESGARVAEIMNAMAADVNRDTKTIVRVLKGGERVTVDAGPWVLFAASRDMSYLCPREDGSKKWIYDKVKTRIRDACKASGIPRITAHYLRHGRACWDLIEGKTIQEVKEKLGHRSVVTTERYSKHAKQLSRGEEPGTVHARPVKIKSWPKRGPEK